MESDSSTKNRELFNLPQFFLFLEDLFELEYCSNCEPDGLHSEPYNNANLVVFGHIRSEKNGRVPDKLWLFKVRDHLGLNWP